MFQNRAIRQRSRASVACAGCRARRTRCIIGEGETTCDRCQRTRKQCVFRDDDRRKRPVSKAHIDGLLRRISTLEKTIHDEGMTIPDGPDFIGRLEGQNEPAPSIGNEPRTQTEDLGVAACSPPSSWTSDEDNRAAHRVDPSSPSSRVLSTKQHSISAVERIRRASMGSSPRESHDGHARYFGITTNYHIYSDAYQNEMSLLREFQSNDAKNFLAGIPADTHDYLMERFWNCYNMVIHVVHKEAFESDRTNHRTRYYSDFLHICMLGMGYRYADRSRHGVSKMAESNRKSIFHDKAKSLVEYELTVPGGLPSIPALILLGDLEAGIGKHNTGWLYAGMASRLCFDLGLNKDLSNPSISQLEVQARQTVFWASVLLDRYWGLFLGYPSSINLSNVSVSDKERPLHDCLPMGHEHKMETGIYKALLGLIEVASRLTNTSPCEFSANGAAACYFVAGFDAELRSWYQALPEPIKWSECRLETAPSNYFFLHQQYHALFILLYRQFTPDAVLGTNDRGLCSPLLTDSARKACFSHATEIARIVSAFCRRFNKRSMFVTGMQHAATAALALVETMSTAAPKEHPQTLIHLQCLAELLYANAATYFPAKIMSDMLFSVIEEYRAGQNRQPGVSFQASKGNTSTGCQVPANTGQPVNLTNRMLSQPDTETDGLNDAGFGTLDNTGYPLSPLQNELLGQQWTESGAIVDPHLSGNGATDMDHEMWESILNILSQPLEY